jgi:hypothetical protein
MSMKKIKQLLGLALLLIALSTTAQPKCFNFDDSIIGITANKENAFDLFKGVGQPLEGWLSVSGSPSIFPNIAGVNYPSGKQCLLLGACGSNRAEGAAYNYNFQSGKNYKVSFKYRYYSIQTTNSPLNTVDVLLTDGLVHNNQGGCGTISVPAIPSGADNLLSLTSFKDTVWQTAALTVSGLTQSHAQLWFRINISSAIANAPYLLVDDVCIEELSSPICFNFDDSIVGTLQNKENAVDLFRGVGQPLEGWTSVNGSPSILPNVAGINYPSGTQCLLIGACGNNRAEGVAFNYNFVAGKNYKVTFEYRYYTALATNVPLDSFDVILTDGLTHNNQGGCGSVNVVNTPAGAKKIFSKPNFNTATWQTATVYASGLTKDFSQIWWRVNIKGNTPTSPYLLLDDICIEESTTNAIEMQTSNTFIQLYPNPALHEVFIAFGQATDLKDVKVQVFNMLGEEMYLSNTSIVGDKIRIQTSDLNNGNYCVRIINTDRTSKIVHMAVIR